MWGSSGIGPSHLPAPLQQAQTLKPYMAGNVDLAYPKTRPGMKKLVWMVYGTQGTQWEMGKEPRKCCVGSQPVLQPYYGPSSSEILHCVLLEPPIQQQSAPTEP